MSGAEALFAVGIICNAMQIITFGKDALHVYRSMRENGVTDPRLDSYLALAATSYKNLGDQSRGPMPLTSDQQQLLDICEKAHKGLLEFQSKFKALELDEQSRKGLLGMARVVKVGIKTLLQSKELKDLENDFQRYEHLFQTRLIHQVCSQADASALLTQEAFTRLEAAQQNVVIKLAEGHTKLSDLLSRESAAIKDHVQEQHLDTRTDVSKHIRDAELHVKSHVSESSAKVQHDLALRSKEVDDNKRHEQLLASLRYPEMNARKNQVAANSPNTCRWLFETQRSPWSSDSGSIDSYSHETGDSDESSDNLSGKETNDNQEDVDESGLDNDTDSSASVSEEPTPFARWLMSDSGMFWISGKPASGKSTLMKFIATSPLTTENLDIWRPSVKVLTHYFWKPGSGMEKSLRGMLLSLAHQVLLCRVDLVRRLWEEPEMAFIHHKWSQADWALEEIEDLLCRTLEVSDDAFFIIIDGLDESTEFERYLSTPHHNSNVLDRLIQLNKVKICASSREETTFCRCFEGVEKLRIHDLTKHDIREFANSRLGCLPFLNDFDRGRLLNEVTLGADGVFLWVSLVLDSVSRTFRLTNDIEALIERVEHAPRDIMKLFQDIWERSGDDGDVASYQVTASRYLNLALVAQRCVQKYAHCTFERFHSLLAIAIALDTREVVSMLDQVRIAPIPDILAKCSIVEQELRTICCGFLEIGGLDISGGGERVHECLLDYVNKNISFIHRCAVDYLTDTESGALLLGACGWSEEESKARLLGGVMTGYCFVVPLPSFDKPFDLARFGIDFKILERRPGPLEVGQADGVQCRTVEIFESLGLSEKLLEEAYNVMEVAFWSPDDDGQLQRKDLAYDTEEGLSHLPHVILNQARINDMMLQEIIRLRGNGTSGVVYGSQVESVRVLDDADDYPVEAVVSQNGWSHRYRAQYAIGCDGAHSTVRKSLGFKMVGDSSDSVWGVMDVYPITNFPDIRKKAMLQSQNNGNLMIIPREGDEMVRFYIELAAATARDVTEQDLINKVKGIFHPYDIDIARTVWWSAYVIGQRVADHFTKDFRVFLTGDACHTHSPKAGQGMNVSLQDGFNIGWKMAHVLTGRAPPAVLKTYVLERQQTAEQLIEFDRSFSKIFSSEHRKKNGLSAQHFRDKFVEAGRYTAGMATWYQPSILTCPADSNDSVASGLTVGMRFPSAPVVRLSDAKPLQLNKILPADGRWHVLTFCSGEYANNGLHEVASELDNLIKMSTPTGNIRTQ
ncbi:hypothetical protein ACHAP5_006442 [Fusarium lateritium]